MAQFSIEIPDELLPALVAEFAIVQNATTATTPEEYFAFSIVEIVRQRAEIYKVGPYYVGPTEPQFNVDGTPYVPVTTDPEGTVDVVTDPLLEEPILGLETGSNVATGTDSGGK